MMYRLGRTFIPLSPPESLFWRPEIWIYRLGPLVHPLFPQNRHFAALRFFGGRNHPLNCNKLFADVKWIHFRFVAFHNET